MLSLAVINNYLKLIAFSGNINPRISIESRNSIIGNSLTRRICNSNAFLINIIGY